MGQLCLESSIRELKHLACSTLFRDSPLVYIIPDFKNENFNASCSLLNVEIILYSSRKSKSLFILFCRCIGNLCAHCFLKSAVHIAF